MIESKRVSLKSPSSWELGGESLIYCALVPDPPRGGEDTVVRLTHTNGYGPVDDVRFFVRLGDLKNPTRFDDLDSASDWKAMELIEEVVDIDGEERYRSEVEKFDPREEIIWYGTFEAVLTFSEGKQRVEIKVLSDGHLDSGVISDWRIRVQE